jgi:FkbM family methyltransferase
VLPSFVRRNLPSRKPQLWRSLPGSALRKLWLAGATRLWPSRLEAPVRARLVDSDLVLEVDPRDAVGNSIFLFGVFEYALTAVLRALLRPGMTFVDVGANLGYYTVLAARAVGPSGQVIAFEPVEAIRHRLQRNLALNDLSNVQVRSEALWRNSALLPFFESADARNLGIGSLVPGHDRVQAGTVQAICLDEVWRAHGRIDLLKIDIEGGERAALQGAQGLAGSSQAPIIVFESFDLPAVRPLLEDAGYLVLEVGYAAREGVVLVPPGTPRDDPFAGLEAPNYLALPRNAHGQKEELLRALR